MQNRKLNRPINMNIKLLLTLTLFTYNITKAQQSIVSYSTMDKAKTYQAYITKAGDTIQAGDRIEIGQPRTDVYTYITQGNMPSGPIIAGATPIVKKIKVVGNKKRGYRAYVLFGGYGLSVYIDWENAVKTGEVLND